MHVKRFIRCKTHTSSSRVFDGFPYNNLCQHDSEDDCQKFKGESTELHSSCQSSQKSQLELVFSLQLGLFAILAALSEVSNDWNIAQASCESHFGTTVRVKKIPCCPCFSSKS
jgi:hypothetical protein